MRRVVRPRQALFRFFQKKENHLLPRFSREPTAPQCQKFEVESARWQASQLSSNSGCLNSGFDTAYKVIKNGPASFLNAFSWRFFICKTLTAGFPGRLPSRLHVPGPFLFVCLSC